MRPRVGQVASDFCLPASSGEVVCLRDLLAEGPVLLWFHRGHRSPQSRQGLAHLRDGYHELRRHGATVAAISPDARTETIRLGRELELPFLLLSDEDRAAATAFGIARARDLEPAAFLLDRRGYLQWFSIADGVSRAAVHAASAALRTGRLAVPGPSSVLTPLVATLVLVAFAGLGLLAAFANRSLLWWDEPVSDAIRGIDVPTFTAVMASVNELGSRWVIGALMLPVLAIAWFRCRQLAVVIALAFVAAIAIELLLKALVDRPRPPGGRGFGQSFPSGHVLAAVAFWGLIPPWVYVVTRRRWAWALAGGLAVAGLLGVGMSRVYVGAHWPSDVAGGYLAGVIFLLVAEWSVRQRWRTLRCEACELHPLRERASPVTHQAGDPALSH